MASRSDNKRSEDKGKVLLVDDEANALTVYAALLGEWGLRVVCAGGGLEAMEIMSADAHVVAAVVDLKMPPPDGMALFRWIRKERPAVPVIILTAHGSIDSAVSAMSEGAFHYLAKPPEPEQLRSILDKALSHVAMTREIERLRGKLEEMDDGDGGGMVGSSASFRRSVELAAAVASSEAPVLILGETGTGKEVLARFIHRRSRRAAGPFVSLNCGAVPPNLLESELFGHEKGAFTGAVIQRRGRFEEADGGTIFLDEVGDCSPDLQVKLLRVLEEKEFSRLGSNRTLRSDFRLLAATHRDLSAAVRAGAFREDLFFRLNVVELTLPPLRERREDVPALAWSFLRRSARIEERPVDGFSAEALGALAAYHWPGNIRQLENVVHRAVILADKNQVTLDHLPQAVRAEASPPETAAIVRAGGGDARTLDEWEKIIIKNALARCGGNKSRAARELGISRKVLYAKLA